MPKASPKTQTKKKAHLIQIDLRPPEAITHLMEIAHSDLAKVSGMVLVDVCAVVVLATCHTATSGMLAVLADAAVAGGDVAAAVLC